MVGVSSEILRFYDEILRFYGEILRFAQNDSGRRALLSP
jgi:hypothetical protein